MQIAFRHYNGADDFQRISDFLITHHQPGNTDGNGRFLPQWVFAKRPFAPAISRFFGRQITVHT